MRPTFFWLFTLTSFLLTPWQANAALSEFYSVTGNFSISVDAGGSNDLSHTIEVEKPNDDSTVYKAYVLAASHGQTIINDGDITIDGNSIMWDRSVSQDASFNENFFHNVQAEVTNIVKPIIDSYTTKTINFIFEEVNTKNINGEILVVIFNDLTVPKQTISLLFGGQDTKGETFVITFNEIDPNTIDSKADFGLGISHSITSDQYSKITVNNTTITSSAGGADDGNYDEDGQLVTVGGLYDTNDNPIDPLAHPTYSRTDDELYSLLPFISSNDKNISVFTKNPSNDDDIFFAYFVLSGTAIINEGMFLKPDSANNEVGDTHTVIAVVANENGERVSDRLVNFEILEGSPNIGITGSTTTNSNGEASFTYTIGGGDGVDLIRASFIDSAGEPKPSSNISQSINIIPITASFTVIPNTGNVPLNVTLDASSSIPSNRITNYQWQSSDEQVIPPGVNSLITYTQPGDYQITLTVTDNQGGTHSTQQFIKVLISNQDALRVLLQQRLGAESINFEDRFISFVIGGETHKGLLSEQIIQSTSSANEPIIKPIADINDDGIKDYLITYPSGDQQTFYYFGTSNEPSQEALKRYLESIGAETIIINADNSLSLILNGITYQGQLAAEIIPGTPTDFLSLTQINNVNGDAIDDYEVIYPTGERQNIYYLGEPPEILLTTTPLSSTEISTSASMAEFLYTGDDPIQTEVVEGTIDPDRLAILRGRVTNRNGQPLSEVTITLLNRSEFGQTRTLSDGTFSLAVNGGESFAINYTKAGYLSSQRQVNTETQGFFWANDVVLTPIELSQVSTIDLGVTNTEPMQVVQGSEVTSIFELNPELDRPSRQSTLFFPQGTTATLSDGTQLDQLDISITEYTINDNDLAAMPAPLPSGSGYTYAVNVSAINVANNNSRTDVKLSQSIPFYVDNFLGFDTGTIVPLGRLDDTNQSRWIPTADGRVIKVLGVDNGIATLDTTGDGFADNDLGISEAEKREIAKQFPQAGKDFWRVMIDKLGNFDLNWPLKTLEKLGIKLGQIASTAGKLLQDIGENPCVKNGCIIEAERQVLGETIPVVGAAFNLNYRSSRTAGRNANYQLDIPLQDSSVPTPKRIKLEVSIGGQRISKVFSDKLEDNPESSLDTPRYTYEWDGKDGYGRSLHGQGRHEATVRIGYVYDGVYEVPPEITQFLIDVQCSTENPEGSFGCISTTAEINTSIPARQEVVGWQEYKVDIGGWFPRNAGLGEWTIDVHHAYDPNAEILYFGNGGQRQVIPIKQDGKILIASEDGGLVYEFNRTGRHLRTIDSLTNNTIYTFSYLNGFLVTIEDIDGDITTIERNTNNLPLAIVAPYGQRSELALDANGYLASVKNPAAEIHQMEYTVDGLLTQFTNPRNHIAEYKYDALGLLVEDINFAKGGWKLERSEIPEVNGYLVTMTSKMGRVSGFNVATLDDGTFQRITTAPDGTQTIVTRKTEDDNKFSLSERADGTKIILEEGPELGRFGMQVPLATNLLVETPNGLVSAITTERIVELEDENNPLSLQKLTEKVTVNGHTSSSVYDVNAKKITTTSAAGRESVSYFDDKGRVIREHTSYLADVYSNYDERGRLIETRIGDGFDARTATISYDDNGYISEVTDVMGGTVSFIYDAVGRVTTQTLVDRREINYSYDANGNVTSITPPGRPAHDFAYTPMDLQAEYTPPKLENIPEPQTEYKYNLDKQLVEVIRPDERIISFDYGETSGRLNAITVPKGEFNYQYDTTGNLNSIESPMGKLIYTYDGSLALSETWGAGSPVIGKVSLTYDNNFRVVSSQVNGSHTVDYEYDADGLLTRSGFLALDYHKQTGVLTDTRLGDLATQRTNNSFAEIETVTATYAESALYQTKYIYEPLGRIVEKNETIEGVEVSYIYVYDEGGSLIEVAKDGYLIEEYTYDSNGNRLSAGIDFDFVVGDYDEQDRLVRYGDTSYKYTANGELLSKGDITYTYDAFGNLGTVELTDKKIEYIVDGRNRRIGKLVDGNFTQGFLYQGSLNPVAELGVSGDVVTRFVYGSKSNVPDYMLKDGSIYRILSDHLGSPRLVVDIVDGTVVQRMDYDAFGNVVLDTNPGFQPFGFAGGLYDIDTGLVRFGARDYDPETGRWTAKDPILFEGGDTNLYGYVLNDPVNFVDPFGLIIDTGKVREDFRACLKEMTNKSQRIDKYISPWIGNILGKQNCYEQAETLENCLKEKGYNENEGWIWNPYIGIDTPWYRWIKTYDSFGRGFFRDHYWLQGLNYSDYVSGGGSVIEISLDPWKGEVLHIGPMR